MCVVLFGYLWAPLSLWMSLCFSLTRPLILLIPLYLMLEFTCVLSHKCASACAPHVGKSLYISVCLGFPYFKYHCFFSCLGLFLSYLSLCISVSKYLFLWQFFSMSFTQTIVLSDPPHPNLPLCNPPLCLLFLVSMCSFSLWAYDPLDVFHCTSFTLSLSVPPSLSLSLFLSLCTCPSHHKNICVFASVTLGAQLCLRVKCIWAHESLSGCISLGRAELGWLCGKGLVFMWFASGLVHFSTCMDLYTCDPCMCVGLYVFLSVPAIMCISLWLCLFLFNSLILSLVLHVCLCIHRVSLALSCLSLQVSVHISMSFLVFLCDPISFSLHDFVL